MISPHTAPEYFADPLASQESSSSQSLPVNVSSNERWVSLAAGGGLLLAGLSKRSFSGLLLAAIGGGLLYRGAKGHCALYQSLGIDTADHPAATAVPAQAGARVEHKIIVNRPVAELYAFWSDLTRLPMIMSHLEHVELLDQKRTRWTAKAVLGTTVTWDAETINQWPNELIAWRSLPGSDVDTAGSIHFTHHGDQATEVRVSMKYNPPAGKLGIALAKLLGDDLQEKLRDDLERFKVRMEQGVLAAATDLPQT